MIVSRMMCVYTRACVCRRQGGRGP